MAFGHLDELQKQRNLPLGGRYRQVSLYWHGPRQYMQYDIYKQDITGLWLFLPLQYLST